jgi:DNA polymerase III epsilon subunit-like protein
LDESYLHDVLYLLSSGRPLMFLDTETTGFIGDLPDGGHTYPSVYELAAVKRTADGVRQAHSRYLNPGQALTAQWCNKISMFDANGQPDIWRPMREGAPPVEVYAKFGQWLADSIIIGHNIVAFDAPIVAAGFEAAGLVSPVQFKEPLRHSIDTLVLGRAILGYFSPRQAPVPDHYNLGDLATFLHIAPDGDLHHAAADTALCELVFDELVARTTAILRAYGHRVA